MRMIPAAIVAVLALVLAACNEGAFVCGSDGECGEDGVCEPSGDCSFTDDDCGSGRRFGSHGAADIAGMCVPDESGSETETEIASMSGDASGGEGQCACTAEVPAGWDGPVALVADGDTPQCAAAADEVLALFDELDVPEPACECRCDAGDKCDGADLWSGGEACFVHALASPGLDACTDLGDAFTIGIRWNIVDTSCVADDRSSVAPAVPRNRFALCSAPAPTCDADVCGACIHRAGTHACPSGYDERRVLHESVADDRACTPCACDSGGQVVCAAQFFDDDACTFEVGEPEDSLDGDACSGYGPGSVRLLDHSTCAPEGGEALGAAVPSDPVTVCCAS